MKNLKLLILFGFLLVTCHLSLVTVVCAGNLKVFPNPFKPALNHTKITFDNLTAGSSIRIYSVTGKLVWEKLDIPSTQVWWYAENTASQKLAAGVYTYVITLPDTSAAKIIGKVGISR